MAELKIISMDEVQSKEVNWLWYPYIPYGKITIIQGDPGEGKTTLALRLAALLSKGEALPYLPALFHFVFSKSALPPGHFLRSL